MTTIWKFEIRIEDEPTAEMPVGSRVLSVVAGDLPAGYPLELGRLTLWALVPDTEASKEIRHFFVIGTGNPIPYDLSDCSFLGTAQIRKLALHVFDRRSIRRP